MIVVMTELEKKREFVRRWMNEFTKDCLVYKHPNNQKTFYVKNNKIKIQFNPEEKSVDVDYVTVWSSFRDLFYMHPADFYHSLEYWVSQEKKVDFKVYPTSDLDIRTKINELVLVEGSQNC